MTDTAVEAKRRFAIVSWNVDDVYTLRPDWTPERAERFLLNNEKHLRDAMVRTGWDALEALIQMEE